METAKSERPGTHLWFLLTADELYSCTRFAYFAFFPQTVFRLAHHTIEYYLKAGLANFVSDRAMRSMGHDISALYHDFREQWNPSDDFSRVIDYIDLFERLRYPRPDSFTHFVWGLPFDEFFKRFDTPELQAKASCICLPDFDRIVASIRSSATRDSRIAMPVLSEEHAEILYKDNASFVRPVV
jgi:hypothetical protein